MKHGWGRGAYMRHLRQLLSLDCFESKNADQIVRLEAVRRACRVIIGEPVDFGAGKGGSRYLAGGWSYPEVDGVCADEPELDGI